MVDELLSKLVNTRPFDTVEDLEAIYEEAKEVLKGHDVEIDLHHIGGYDSPGYDIDFFIISWVEDGRARFFTAEIECY